MAENRLGIGRISWPTGIDQDLAIALEELVVRIDDNIEYLLKPRIISVSSTYTATDLDFTILADASSGALTVTLPDAAVVEGKILAVKKTDSSGAAVTVDGNGSQTIDGGTQGLASQYDSLLIQSDGSNWHVLSDK